MEQTLNTAKRLLAGLYEIHPNICVHGLNDEFEKISEMKADLALLVAGLTANTAVMIPDYKGVERAVVSRRLDVISSFEEVLGLAPVILELATDGQLQVLSMAAENGVSRFREYVTAREAYRLHIRSQNTTYAKGENNHAG